MSGSFYKTKKETEIAFRLNCGCVILRFQLPLALR